MTQSAPKHVPIFYEKGYQFRVIHVDGFVGGPTPTGYLRMAPYSDRQKLPNFANVPVDENGVAIGPEELDQSPGVDRTLECDMLLDLNAAINLYVWLEKRINDLGMNGGFTDEQLREVLKLKRESQR